MLNLEDFLSDENLALVKKLDLLMGDFEEKFIKGSGKGGQKINKTSSCVNLRYLPLDLEVRVQKHRELQKNRQSAWKLLLKKIETEVLGEDSREFKRIERLKKQKNKRKKRAKLKLEEKEGK